MRNLFLSIILLTSSSVFSQEYKELEPINITNSRTFQNNSNSGKNITIIDGSYFEKMPVSSLDELLKFTPGIEVQQRGPAGSQADIIIRGGTFQQVLVLIDGMKFNDPITGHFSGYIPVTPSEIARIEILKGPAAAMYGSEAVGGVVHIISKSFLNKTVANQEKLHYNITAGMYGLINVQAGIFKKIGNHRFQIGAVSNNADGHLLRSQKRGYFHNQTFSGSYSTTFKNQWQLMIHSSIDQRDFAAENYYTTFKSDTANELVKTWWNHAKLKKTKQNKSDEIDAVFKSTNDHYVYNPSSTANENQSMLIDLQYTHLKTVSSKMNYVYGLLLEQKQIQSNDRGNHSNNHAAVFGASTIKINKLFLNPGIRLISDENYGFNFLPQLNASLPIHQWTIRGGFGKAIRSADFTERYNNFNKRIVKGGSIGNPDLTAEKSWNYETGIDYSSKHFKCSASGFYRNQNELIDFVNTAFKDIPRNLNLDSNGKFAFAKNIKTVNTTGAEFEVNYSFRIKSLSISFNNSALILDSKSSDSVPSYYILSHAKFLLQQTLIFKYNKTEICVSSLYKKRNAQSASAINAYCSPSYWLANFKIQRYFSKASVFISSTNIGDINYSDLLGSKMPGRWTSCGLTIKL